MDKWKCKVSPKIIEKLKVLEQKSRYYEVSHAGNRMYEKDFRSENWIVDIVNREWVVSSGKLVKYHVYMQ